MSDRQLHYWVVIPAAGVGKRFGSEVPKQYMRIAKRTVLEHTLACFVRRTDISRVVLAVAADDTYWQQSVFYRHEKILAVNGGAERMHSVFAGLQALAALAAGTDWVLVHDAVRPCVSDKDIDDLIVAVADHPHGGLLGFPVADTLKRVDAARQSLATVAREHLWHALTPQIFRFSLLYEALQQVVENGTAVTDEAMAIELHGGTPLLVMGNPANIKITRQQDLAIAADTLQQQHPQCESDI